MAGLILVAPRSLHSGFKKVAEYNQPANIMVSVPPPPLAETWLTGVAQLRVCVQVVLHLNIQDG